MNDAYIWPVRTVTDYAEDRISISEGSLQHIKEHHPSFSSDDTLDIITSVLVDPAGGVYRNPPEHSAPHRLNYYSAETDTPDGPERHQVIVDKDQCDPHKVITAWATDRISPHGECVLEPTDGGEQ